MIVLVTGTAAACSLDYAAYGAQYGGGASNQEPAQQATRTPAPTNTPDGLSIYYQPVWQCATPSPVPTECSKDKNGNETCTSPEPTATPYILLNDFPLGRHVQIGPIGTDELGVWAWIDNVRVENTSTVPDYLDGATEAWIAVWDITVENGSESEVFRFVPLLSYVYEVELEDGSTQVGRWGADPNAAKELTDIGWAFPALSWAWELTDESGDANDYENVSDSWDLDPGDQRTLSLATYVPGPNVLRLAFSFAPTNGQENTTIWRTEENEADKACTGEVTPGPDGLPAVPLLSANPGAVVLSRWPVDSGTITRGFGCTADFTGVTSSTCDNSSQPWFHNGIDIAVSSGSPVYDVLGVNGTILFAGVDSTGADCSTLAGSEPPQTGLGNYLSETGIIEGSQVEVVFGHLSSIQVNTNQATTPEQQLGLSGSTGCSSAPHVHLSVLVDGDYVDPMLVLP